MKRAGTAVVLVLAMAAAGAAAPHRDGKRWWSFVEMLANDDMQGRDTGSPAHRKAADLIAAEFQRAGLTPAGVNGYLQPVKFSGRKIVEAETSLELVRNGKAEKLTLGEDAVVSLRINPADTVEAPLVFAGYGLTVPDLNYNDLAGLDLKGKILVVLSGGPSTVPGPLRSHFSYPIERKSSSSRPE